MILVECSLELFGLRPRGVVPSIRLRTIGRKKLILMIGAHFLRLRRVPVQSVDQLSELVEIQASLCGGFSVLCCASRRSPGGSRGGGRRGGGGPAYSAIEMGSQQLVEGGEGAFSPAQRGIV